MEDGLILDLVARLCAALSANGIEYCHWKSNPFLDRSASGENDLDLLVGRTSAPGFEGILCDLGFKETLAPARDDLPGVRNFYGRDAATGRLVHVHAHYQLILGNDLSKNYRLPVEQAYLDSACQGKLFRIPAPEFELVIFVLRMVLKHSTWDSVLIRHGKLSRSERAELECLTAAEVLQKVDGALSRLQLVDRGLFDLCLRAVQPGCPLGVRVRAGRQLQAALDSYARLPHGQDVLLKLVRRVWWPLQWRLFRIDPKSRFAHGGLFVAIVGGDGAGKTTVLDQLSGWLSGTFEVERLHMGKPRWSATTILIRALLKIGTLLHLYSFEGDTYETSLQPHGYPWFLRAVCTARDRYLTYVKGRRASSNGALVLCDRFSLPGFLSMDGPQCERALATAGNKARLAGSLARQEASYYRKMGMPDLLIVLSVSPEIAVQRKTEETEESVRARSTEVFSRDWAQVGAHVIDASQSRAEIASQIGALLWQHL